MHIIFNIIKQGNKCTVKPVLVATTIKQAICIKQVQIDLPKLADAPECTCNLASTCLNQAHFDYPCIVQVGLKPGKRFSVPMVSVFEIMQ